MKDYSGIERGELIEEIYRKEAEVVRLRALVGALVGEIKCFSIVPPSAALNYLIETAEVEQARKL